MRTRRRHLRTVADVALTLVSFGVVLWVLHSLGAPVSAPALLLILALLFAIRLVVARRRGVIAPAARPERRQRRVRRRRS